MEYNERDIEYPALINFIKKHNIKSILDVGAFYSYKTYAKELSELVDSYTAIDIDPDPITSSIVDKYYVGNVLDHKGSYECISCISTIEHSGISSYKNENYISERFKVFKKLSDLSAKYIFLTFPYGKESFHENEFANITSEQLEIFTSFCKKVNTIFYFSENPQGKVPFTVVDKSFADKVEYKRELGTRCVCIMEIEK